MKIKAILAGATAFVIATSAAHAEDWDMPMAYSASNFHSEMGVVFADKVRDYTGGDINITVHPGGSLFKGGEKLSEQYKQAKLQLVNASCLHMLTKRHFWDGIIFLS